MREELDLTRSQLHTELGAKMNLEQTLGVMEGSFCEVKRKLGKADKKCHEQRAQLDDLRSSVQLKIGVADDLQSLLKESHLQVNEAKRENKVLQQAKEHQIEQLATIRTEHQQLLKVSRHMQASIANPFSSMTD